MKKMNRIFCGALLACATLWGNPLAASTASEYATVGMGKGDCSFMLGGNKQTVTLALYKASEVGIAGKIKALSWYTQVADTSSREVYIYLQETTDTVVAAAKWSDIQPTLKLHQIHSRWSNSAGWNTINLDSVYTYSGNKNLLVTVRVVSNYNFSIPNPKVYGTLTYPYQCSRIGYGNINDMGTTNIPADFIRPNIRFTFEAPEAAPVAGFVTSNQPILFFENFDGQNTIPTGWAEEIKGGGGSWTFENNSPSYRSVDGTSVYSASLSNYPSSTQDSWLKSPYVAIPQEGASLGFSLRYYANRLDAGSIELYAQEEGQSEVRVWTTGTVNEPNAPSSAIWKKINVNLAAYAGKKVRLAWRLYGPGGHNNGPIGLDDVKLIAAFDNGKLNVMAGNKLQLINKSRGMVDSYRWTLEGADTPTSTDEDPYVGYSTKGLYKVKLVVSNPFGADSMEVDTLVNVISLAPMADFTSTSPYSFTRRANHGRFIAAGSSLGFQNKSGNNPNVFAWEFEGGNPATASTASATVNYPNNGSYSVKFTASNISGIDSIFKADYVKVGGTDSVWNMPDGDNGTHVLDLPRTGDVRAPTGYMTGQNSGFLAYSERFVSPSAAEISSVKLNMMVSGTRRGEVFKVQIYTAKRDSIHGPDLMLASADLPVDSIKANGYTTITFPTPIPVSDTFHVVVRGFNPLGNNTNRTSVAIRSSDLQKSGGTTYLLYTLDHRWYEYSKQSQFHNPRISLNIVPTLTFVDKTKGFSVESSALNFGVAGGGKSVKVTSPNGSWYTYSTASWLTAARAANGDSIAVSCSANTGVRRSATVYLRYGLEEKSIAVTQDAATGITLTAKYSLGTSVTEQLSWTADSAFTQRQTWSNAIPYNGISSSSDTNVYIVAVRWDSIDLVKYGTAKLTAVDMYVGSSAKYTLKVYNSTLVYSQAINSSKLIQGNYNRILLDSAITINTSKLFMVGCEITKSKDGSLLAAYDSAPAVNMKGNLISVDGSGFVNLTSIFPKAGNWCMSAIIEGQPRKTYDVYRDNAKITTVSSNTYTDTHTGNGCYKVALANSSGMSNEVCLSAITDAATTAILKPIVAGSPRTIVQARFKNNGTYPITSMQLAYQVNGGAPVVETYSGSLTSQQTTDYTFTAKANLSTNQAYKLKVWCVLANDSIHANDTASVSLVYTTYTINSSAGANGSVTPSGSVVVAPNEDTTFTFTPSAGYVVDSVIVDGVYNLIATTNGSYKFTNVTANHSIRATFKLVLHKITANTSNNNGTLTPRGTIFVIHGRDTSFTIIPKSGYIIAQLLVDNVDRKVDMVGNRYFFSNVSSDHSLMVNFAQTSYSITASVSGKNGSISDPGLSTIEYGASQRYTITPDPNYEIATVLIDGVNDTVAVKTRVYTFTNVTANHTIAVSFVAKTVTGIDDVDASLPAVYPSPSTGRITIDNNGKAIRKIQVFDLNSNLLREVNEVGTSTYSMELPAANGVYFIKVNGKTTKVVKQ